MGGRTPTPGNGTDKHADQQDGKKPVSLGHFHLRALNNHFDSGSKEKIKAKKLLIIDEISTYIITNPVLIRYQIYKGYDSLGQSGYIFLPAVWCCYKSFTIR